MTGGQQVSTTHLEIDPLNMMVKNVNGVRGRWGYVPATSHVKLNHGFFEEILLIGY